MDGMVVEVFGKGLIKGMWTTLKHLFEKDLTIQYPEEMPYLQDRYRGHLIYEIDKCTACNICARTCPNNVLHLESARNEATKKREVVTFSIDHQYCMFCNLCVEACPADCLHFNHHFELSEYVRDEIKVVYEGTPNLAPLQEDGKASLGELAEAKSSETSDDEDKKAKQINNMINAVKKNPVKVLSRYADSEEAAEILASILINDEAKLTRLVPIMLEDKEKAKKIANAFVNKELKDRAAEKGGEE